MCNKRSSTTIKIDGKNVRVDGCMANLIETLNENGIGTISCCCGHGRYDMSIIVDAGKKIYDLISGKEIEWEKNKRVYITDKNGFYYLPEAQKGRRKGMTIRPKRWWRLWDFLRGYR